MGTRSDSLLLGSRVDPKGLLSFFLRIFEATDNPETDCLRKNVGAAFFVQSLDWICLCRERNGPIPGHQCKNIVGGCGCQHAEPRLLRRSLEIMGDRVQDHKTLVYCQYSPCTDCAKQIIDCEFVNGVVYCTVTEHDPEGLQLLMSHVAVFSTADFRALESLTGTETGQAIADLVERFNVFFGPWDDHPELFRTPGSKQDEGSLLGRRDG